MNLSKSDIEAIADCVVAKLQAAGLVVGQTNGNKKFSAETEEMIGHVTDAGDEGISTRDLGEKLDIFGKVLDSIIQRAKTKGLVAKNPAGLWVLGNGERIAPSQSSPRETVPTVKVEVDLDEDEGV